MLVTPRLGVNRENLLTDLRRVRSDALNLRGGGPQGAHKRLLAYLEWTSVAVQVLGNQISGTDLERLVLTKRYQQLLSGVGTMTGIEVEVQRVVNGLVSLEIDQRIAALDEAIKALDGQIRRWSSYSRFVLPDTSFYIRHNQKLKEADFGLVLDGWGSPINILMPIVVVDELDKLKQSKDPNVRWRAGHTLGVLDEVFEKHTGRGRLHAGDPLISDHKGRDEATIELVFDPPGHVRLPINDDEIIDRALAIEPLADRKVTLLTYDTHMSTRARAAGLKVIKLTKPIGDEPR